MAAERDSSFSPRRRRHSRRRALRRLSRWFKRYWPLWLIPGALAAFLVGVQIKTGMAAAEEVRVRDESFGITVTNRSKEPVRHLELQLWFPDESVETTCRLDDIQPRDVVVKHIYAPPGSRMRITVTFANGTTRKGERRLASGTTQGGMHIDVLENDVVWGKER